GRREEGMTIGAAQLELGAAGEDVEQAGVGVMGGAGADGDGGGGGDAEDDAGEGEQGADGAAAHLAGGESPGERRASHAASSLSFVAQAAPLWLRPPPAGAPRAPGAAPAPPGPPPCGHAPPPAEGGGAAA